MFAPIYFGRRTNEYRAAVPSSPTAHVELKELDVETLRDACAGTVWLAAQMLRRDMRGLATCLDLFRSHEGNDVAIHWSAPIRSCAGLRCSADPNLSPTFR